MNVCVVYESMYGNTHEVALAIASGLETRGDVRIEAVAEIEPGALADVDLLVVGGPTHVHGMSRASTRAAAIEAAEKDDGLDTDAQAAGPGLREWFKRLPNADRLKAAAFDTRVDKPAVITGSAAKGIAKQLRKHGCIVVADPESFFVADSEGPLESGEVDRALQWGRDLADAL